MYVALVTATASREEKETFNFTVAVKGQTEETVAVAQSIKQLIAVLAAAAPAAAPAAAAPVAAAPAAAAGLL